MTEGDWDAGFAKSLAVFLNGEAISEPDPRGQRITDDSFLLLFNAAEHGVEFTIPEGYGEEWSLELDTAEPLPPEDGTMVKAGDMLTLAGWSLRLLRRA